MWKEFFRKFFNNDVDFILYDCAEWSPQDAAILARMESGDILPAAFPIDSILNHCTVTPQSWSPDYAEKIIQQSHKSRGFPLSSLGWNIGYQAIVYGNGEIRQYRKYGEVGAHCPQQNMNFRAVALAYALDGDKEVPTDKMRASIIRWNNERLAQFHLPPSIIKPHRFYNPGKSCYGNKLPNDYVQKLLSLTPQEEEMIRAYRHKNTAYVLAGSKYLGFSDESSFKDLGGVWENTRELTDAEFAKLIQPFLSGSIIRYNRVNGVDQPFVTVEE